MCTLEVVVGISVVQRAWYVQKQEQQNRMMNELHSCSAKYRIVCNLKHV